MRSFHFFKSASIARWRRTLLPCPNIERCEDSAAAVCQQNADGLFPLKHIDRSYLSRCFLHTGNLIWVLEYRREERTWCIASLSETICFGSLQDNRCTHMVIHDNRKRIRKQRFNHHLRRFNVFCSLGRSVKISPSAVKDAQLRYSTMQDKSPQK